MSFRLLGFDRQGVVVGIDGQNAPVCIANLVEDGLPSGPLGQGNTNLGQPMGSGLANQPSGGKVCLVSVSHVQGLIQGQDGDAVHMVNAKRFEAFAGDGAGFGCFAVWAHGSVGLRLSVSHICRLESRMGIAVPLNANPHRGLRQIPAHRNHETGGFGIPAFWGRIGEQIRNLYLPLQGNAGEGFQLGRGEFVMRIQVHGSGG